MITYQTDRHSSTINSSGHSGCSFNSCHCPLIENDDGDDDDGGNGVILVLEEEQWQGK